MGVETFLASSAASVQSATSSRHLSSSRMLTGGRLNCRRPVANTDFLACPHAGGTELPIGPHPPRSPSRPRPRFLSRIRLLERGRRRGRKRHPALTLDFSLGTLDSSLSPDVADAQVVRLHG